MTIRISQKTPIFILIIGLMAVAPLWQSGFLNTHARGESPYLLVRVQQMTTALQAGHFPVRWMPDGAYGLGYPFFNFYAALPYYVASFFHLLGFSIVISLKMTHTLGFIIGAQGMFSWARRHVKTDAAALFAAAMFTFAPIHLINIYIRGDSLSEFWAMGFFPVILWAIDRLIDRPRPQEVAIFALSSAALVLSHNLSALMFAPLAAIYGLMLINQRRAFLALMAGGLLALMLSAWLWLPAIGGMSDVQTDDRMTTGYFYWGNHVLDGQLMQSSILTDYETFPPQIAAWQTAMIGLGVFAMAISWRKFDRFRLLVLLILMVATMMTLSIAAPIYEHITVFSLVQFPWRWLSIVALGGAMVAAYVVDMEVIRRSSINKVLVTVLIVATAIISLSGLKLNFIPISVDDVTSTDVVLREYYNHDIGTTVTWEYLPAGFTDAIYSGPAVIGSYNLKVLAGSASGELLEKTAVSSKWLVDVQTETATIAIPTLYYPGWQAQADGEKLETAMADGLGWVQTTVSQGRHTLKYSLESTPLQLLANGLSFSGVLILLFSFRKINRWKREQVVSLLFIPIVLVMGLIATRFQSPVEGPIAADGGRDSLHRVYPQGLIFDETTSLPPSVTAYAYPQVIQAGETLRIHLTWDRPTSSAIRAALIPPLVRQWQLDAALTVDYGTDVIELAIPPDAAPGLYFVRLGKYDLQPVRVIACDGCERTQARLLDIHFGEALRLSSIRTEPVHNNEGWLNVYLGWDVLRPIATYYTVSVRLYAPDGRELAAVDVPMGVYGAYPPVHWSGRFTDWVTLTGLEGLPPAEGYRIGVGVYSADEVAGSTQIRDIAIQNVPDTVNFQPETGMILTQNSIEQGDRLPVEVTWRGAIQEGWQFEWRFTDDESIITPMALGVRLDWWQADQSYRYLLPLMIDLPPQVYTVQWRIIDKNGHPQTDFATIGQITVKASTRQFAPIDAPTIATFGHIRLSDYTITDNRLALTWVVDELLASNYTLFVHVINSEDDGVIITQSDITYPSSEWVAGEMIVSEFSFNVDDLAEYDIAVGWYDAQSPDFVRLKAIDFNGKPLIDNRFVLP